MWSSKENIKFDWPKEAVLELIRAWQSYECLYNPKHKFYYNKHARYTALNEIAEQLKTFDNAIGVSEINHKISYLRGQYTREVAKMKEKRSGAGADDIYTPSAYWFEQMSFLEDFIKIRKGNCNLNSEISFLMDDSWDSSQPGGSDTSPGTSKKPRLGKETQCSSSNLSKESAVLSAATTVLQNIASSTTATDLSDPDEAFCRYLRTEMAQITDADLKDDLKQNITAQGFEIKKKKTKTTK